MSAEKIQIKKREYSAEGSAFSLGVTVQGDNRVQFMVWRPGVSSCQLRLYQKGKLYHKFNMDSMVHLGMKDVFSIVLEGENVRTMEFLHGMDYDFSGDGEIFNDIYAKEVSGRNIFGKKHGKVRGRLVFDNFSWKDENWQRLSARDMILYQCHVRGFTKHSSSGVKAPGTFRGLQEKIPYLKELGVNTLLFLPVYDFDEWMKDEEGNEIGKINYWRYEKDAFYFAPRASYGSGEKGVVRELKEMVKALHQNGMNLILDMYFFDQSPEFILQCLRYYALEFHIDGFRINQDAIDAAWLQKDPVLSHVKLLGNTWREPERQTDSGQLMEMNDGFLVDARRFLKSDEGQTENFYRRFKEQQNGADVIHYITSNNGFTLRDLISYDIKHNEENGERNQDGTEYNYSWNCGAEGPSRRKTVLKMREKQEKNAFVMLLLGMATPMILAGDEFGNSQKGNNNAYCQDNLTTWLDWRLLERNRNTFQYVKKLIDFRKNHPLYHQERKLSGMDRKGLGAPDVSCHGREPWIYDFSYYSRDLGVLFYGGYYEGRTLYFLFNFHWDSHEFYLPGVSNSKKWKVILNTSGEQQGEIIKRAYMMSPRSIAVLESIPEEKKEILSSSGEKPDKKISPKKNKMHNKQC